MNTFDLPCRLPTTLTLHFTGPVGASRVAAAWRLAGNPLSESDPVPLDAWLGGSAHARSARVRVQGAGLAALLRALGRPHARAGDTMPSGAWLGIDGALAVTLSFPRAATLAGHQLRSITLAPAPPASPGDWCAGARLPAGQLRFERKGGAVRLAWPDGVQLALLRSGGAAELSGRLALTIGQKVELPCARVRTHRDAAATNATFWTREGHARLGGLHVLLGQGAEPGLLEATGTALTRIQIPIPLAEVALMVPDVDVARLSFNQGATMHRRPARPPARAAPGAGP